MMSKRPKKSRSPKLIEFNVDPAHFFNRDLSWLHFNRRVLAEAADPRNPLLERVRFMIIFSTNLDEFVMKRIGYIKHQVEAGYSYKSVDGKSSEQILDYIQTHINLDIKTLEDIYAKTTHELNENGVLITRYKELADEDKEFCNELFRRKIFPVLTPLTVDPGHPFPFISNLSYSLALNVFYPQTQEGLFSRVKIPDVLPGLIRLKGNEQFPYRFVRLDSIVKNNLNQLFPGMIIKNIVPFRVTRNADVDHREDEAEDLLVLVEEGIKERRLAECVRLEIHHNHDEVMLNFLKDSLGISFKDIYIKDHPIDYSVLKSILDLDLPKLKFKPWAPVIPKAFSDSKNIFSIIRQGDVLLHHPYESFSHTVERFVSQAADDPQVLTIKMTLYRTGDNSSFVKSLIRAAENGKQVVCLIELKARFDEQRNIHLAQKLEDAGVHVVYGILGLKTHSKLALVIRQESDGEITPYAHIGTGNYHSQTSALYTDFGLFTCQKMICHELIEVFNYLTGSSLKTDYEQILVAPINMKSSFIKLIDQEIENQTQGKPARIIAKMNSMEDEVVSEALYRASQSGVKITLFVRGFCCLKPGVSGLSENIEVISVIGRFLEHSRVFYFADGMTDPADGKFYIGSADWMHRNLHNRVEVIVPVYDKKLKDKIWDFLDIHLKDNRQSWKLNPEGDYIQNQPHDEEDVGTHMVMMKKTFEKEKSG